MMMNLFSSFDPTTFKYCSMNWLSSFMMFIIIVPMYWLIPSRMNMIWINLMLYLHKEMKMIIMKNKFKGSTIFFSSLFIFILLNNFMGLFPYIFTSSSHLSMTLSLSLSMWMSLMIFGLLNNYMQMIIHLVPQNAPNMLLPFLIVIETISNLIRPGTLAIRLTANMIAGHLLITLMSSSSLMISNILLIQFLIMVQILLMILEFSVAMIQAYVFSILLILYSKEVM